MFDKVNNVGGAAKNDSLAKDPATGNTLHGGELTNIPKPAAPTGDVTLYFETKALKEMWLAVAWSSV